MEAKEEQKSKEKQCNHLISLLPAGEIKYYLFVLVNSITKEKNNAMAEEFLKVLLKLLHNLNDLHQGDSFNVAVFNQLSENYNKLQTIAQLNTSGAKLKIILLHIGGAIISIFTGMIGGLIGGTIGLFRGTWNLEPFKGLGVGLFTGYCIGAILGFRIPKKLFKDEFLRQIEFSLNGLNRHLDNLRQTLSNDVQEIKPFNAYFEAEKVNIRNQFFSSDSEFEQFLKDDSTYEINSFKAGFIGGSSLYGYLGHHLYIIIKIKGVEHLIEFTSKPADTTRTPEQQEKRTVTGEKIIEMLATYKKLQETSAYSLNYVLTRMKPGDNDCHTLINKVLISTNQPVTTLNRYQGLNNVGSMVGFFISNLSPFPEGFFSEPQSTLKL